MKRQRPIEFSPRLRGNIIRAVAQDGAYRGTRHGISFEILRLTDGVLLLVREGRKWVYRPAFTVLDALSMIEKRTRNACYFTTAEAGKGLAGGFGPISDAGYAGQVGAAEADPPAACA